MTSWPIGLSTGCFYHQSILDCLPLIRESGFSMIEVCSSPEHLDFHDLKSVQRAAERINELGMEAYSFHAPFASKIDIASSDVSQRAASVAEIFAAAEAAALLRVHYFVLHPGPESPAAIPDEEQLPHMQHVVDSVNKIARRCKDLGIMCVLENKLPHLLFGNTSDILWILDGINGSQVGACLDTGHAFLSGDMHNLVHKLTGHLRMIHVHDNGGEGDNHWPPGDGKIDWENFLRDLIEARFRGALVLEMAGNADPAVTMTNARRGRSYLREASRQIALSRTFSEPAFIKRK
jgi:sugar phosphate isomerase/epimerase